jgi:hypothetical protein
VERSTDGTNFSQVNMLPASQTSFTDRDLTSGSSYWYRLRVRNPLGVSDPSNVATAIAK